MGGSRGGDRGPDPSVKSQVAIGFLRYGPPQEGRTEWPSVKYVDVWWNFFWIRTCQCVHPLQNFETLFSREVNLVDSDELASDKTM